MMNRACFIILKHMFVNFLVEKKHLCYMMCMTCKPLTFTNTFHFQGKHIFISIFVYGMISILPPSSNSDSVEQTSIPIYQESELKMKQTNQTSLNSSIRKQVPMQSCYVQWKLSVMSIKPMPMPFLNFAVNCSSPDINLFRGKHPQNHNLSAVCYTFVTISFQYLTLPSSISVSCQLSSQNRI